MFPGKIFEASVAVAVQAGAKIDQAFWFCNQTSKDVGREGVYREDGGQAVDRGYTFSFLIADTGVVDDGVERAELVCVGGDGFGFGDAAEVA